MSVAEMNASSLLDKMKTLPEDVQVKLGYMIEGAALLATLTDPSAQYHVGPVFQYTVLHFHLYPAL